MSLIVHTTISYNSLMYLSYNYVGNKCLEIDTARCLLTRKHNNICHTQPRQMNHSSDLSHATKPDEPQLRYVTENQARWTTVLTCHTQPGLINQARWTTAQTCHTQTIQMNHSSDLSHTTKPVEPQLRSVTHNQAWWTTAQTYHRQPIQMNHSSDLSHTT